MILGKETGDGIRRQQALLDAFKHALLQICNANGAVVVARPLLSVGRTSELISVLNGVRGAAASTLNKA